MQIDMEDIKKLMDGIQKGYEDRGIAEVDFYRGLISGFDIIRHFIKINEDTQDKEQAKQFNKEV